jgi:hypothetical protein
MSKKSSILEDPIFQTLVGAISAFVARIAKLQVAGSYAQALDEIDQALEDLIGLKSNQLLSLTDVFILDLLTVNEYLDIQRLWYLAELINAEGEIKRAQGLKSTGFKNQVRAMGFFLETAFASQATIPQVDAQINALFSRLSEELSEDLLFNLFDHFDRRGNYLNAVTSLDLMLAITNQISEIQAERTKYLQQLLQIPESELNIGGLTIAEVKGKLSL